MSDESGKKIACERIDHEDHVELVFLESSREAVDELIGHLLDVIRNPPNMRVLRIYVNSGKVPEAQPIRYLMGQLRKAQPQLKPDRPAYIAATFNLMPLAQMINLFVTALRVSSIKFRAFGVRQSDDALDWLINQAK